MIDSTAIAVAKGFCAERPKSAVLKYTVDPEATMDADLDTLCIAVYCTADDLLPEPAANARRMVTDAEVVTLCVAQAIMGIPSDRRFLRVARKRLCHLFPALPAQSGYHKRRRRLADTIEWLMGVFASRSPGYTDDLLLIDSTPVECASSRETVKRSALGRRRRLRLVRQSLPLFLGVSAARDLRPRRHAASAHARLAQTRRARGRPRAARQMPAPRRRDACSATRATPGAQFAARRRSDGRHDRASPPQRRGRHAPRTWPRSARRIESIFWTCKDILTLERHGARTLAGIRERILQRFSALAACVSLNHRLGRPSRALVDYVA